MADLEKKPSANYGGVKEKYIEKYEQKTYQYGK